MLTKENQEERRTGIGASEIAAVVGLSPFDTPLTIYERKVGCAPEVEETIDMERGTFLEDGILRWTAHRRGTTIAANNVLVRHQEYKFAVATPDGYELSPLSADDPGHQASRLLFVPTAKRVATFDAKSPRRGDHWTHPDEDRSGIPDHIFIQAQWQMFVTCLPRGIITALLYGEPWIYDIEASPSLQADLLAEAGVFWDRVEHMDPPPPTEPGDASVFGRMVKQKSKTLVVPASVEEAAALAREYSAFKEAEAEAKRNAESTKCKLLPMIGTAAGLDLGKSGPKVSYRASRDSTSTDWEAVAIEAGASNEIIKKHTTTSRGSRRFLVTLPKEK